MRDGPRVWLRLTDGRTAVSGVAVDLSPSGALVKSVRAVRLGAEGVLEVQLGELRRLPVRVIRVDHKSYRPFVGIGLQFGRLGPSDMKALSDLSPYVVERQGGVTRVTFRVGFTEATTFAALLGRLSGPVVFDLAGVRHISSLGVKKWVYFLERLCQDSRDVRFVRCSTAFLKQAAMIRNFLGCGRVVSALVTYSCQDCGRETERELRPGDPVPEELPCPCGSFMEPDMDPVVLETILAGK